MFLQGKICVSARVGKLFTKCLLSEFSVRSSSKKNDISGYIRPRSFNQMVKCSLLDEKIVYQSLFGAALTFSYFLLQGKVLCFARVGTLLRDVYCLKGFEDLVEKVISPAKFDTNRSFKQ